MLLFWGCGEGGSRRARSRGTFSPCDSFVRVARDGSGIAGRTHLPEEGGPGGGDAVGIFAELVLEGLEVRGRGAADELILQLGVRRGCVGGVGGAAAAAYGRAWNVRMAADAPAGSQRTGARDVGPTAVEKPIAAPVVMRSTSGAQDPRRATPDAERARRSVPPSRRTAISLRIVMRRARECARVMPREPSRARHPRATRTRGE